jgi:phytanoyl-CoA hydroxylase
MERTPTHADISAPPMQSIADILPIEYPDYRDRLKHHKYFDKYAAQADFIHQNGYVILENAVNADLCDKLAQFYQSVEKLECQDLPFVEYHDAEGNNNYGVRYSESAKTASSGKFKLVDIFQSNAISREVCFSDSVAEFLSLIFNSDVLAFQQLGFIHGTEQPIHQDTAYVRVSKPRKLAASWIALEDIAPSTGELEFLPCSHKFNIFRFDSAGDKECRTIEQNPSNSIWFDYKNQAEHQEFLAKLEKLKEIYGVERFRAKKGDALVWISFFAHGGSKIENNSPSRTRRSLVTHYCPWPDAHPMYYHNVLHTAPQQFNESCYYSSKLYPIEPLPDCFDGRKYLEANPDVALVPRFEIDPGLHYIKHGRGEGRSIE